jgi:hypothetical protein
VRQLWYPTHAHPAPTATSAIGVSQRYASANLASTPPIEPRIAARTAKGRTQQTPQASAAVEAVTATALAALVPCARSCLAFRSAAAGGRLRGSTLRLELLEQHVRGVTRRFGCGDRENQFVAALLEPEVGECAASLLPAYQLSDIAQRFAPVFQRSARSPRRDVVSALALRAVIHASRVLNEPMSSVHAIGGAVSNSLISIPPAWRPERRRVSRWHRNTTSSNLKFKRLFSGGQ